MAREPFGVLFDKELALVIPEVATTGQNCTPFAVNCEFAEGRRSAIPVELDGKFALPSADLAAPDIS
jgi:hypothetical protein